MTPVGALCRNSEIYNHEAIKEQGALKGVRITKDSKSDSAIIGHLYQKLGDGPELWNMLDGVFACVLYDEETNEYIAARSVVCGASVHTCCAASYACLKAAHSCEFLRSQHSSCSPPPSVRSHGSLQGPIGDLPAILGEGQRWQHLVFQRNEGPPIMLHQLRDLSPSESLLHQCVWLQV